MVIQVRTGAAREEQARRDEELHTEWAERTEEERAEQAEAARQAAQVQLEDTGVGGANARGF